MREQRGGERKITQLHGAREEEERRGWGRGGGEKNSETATTLRAMGVRHGAPWDPV